MNHRISAQDAINHLATHPHGSAGAQGYGAALGLVAGARSFVGARDRVSGFFSSMADGIESAVKWILFLLGAVLVVVVFK